MGGGVHLCSIGFAGFFFNGMTVFLYFSLHVASSPLTKSFSFEHIRFSRVFFVFLQPPPPPPPSPHRPTHTGRPFVPPPGKKSPISISNHEFPLPIPCFACLNWLPLGYLLIVQRFWTWIRVL